MVEEGDRTGPVTWSVAGNSWSRRDVMLSPCNEPPLRFTPRRKHIRSGGGSVRSSRSRIGVGAAALVVCSAWSAGARAEDPGGAIGDGRDLLAQARELYVEGAKAARSGHPDRARLFYISAWRAQHHWQIAGSLGHAELALGRYCDAAEHLAFFLRETRYLTTLDPRDRATIARDLERAKAKVGAVTAIVEPAGAEVLVDGAPVGTAPLADAVFVEPGRHVIEARMPGRVAAVEARDLVPGGATQVVLRLAPVAAVEPPAAQPPQQPPQPLAVAPPPRSIARPNRAIVIGGAVTTGVLAVVGVGLGVGSAMKASASRDCEVGTVRRGHEPGRQAGRVRNQLQAQKVALGYASIGTFIGAGVIGVGTAAYALFSSKRVTLPRTGLVVYPGGAAASMSVDW